MGVEQRSRVPEFGNWANGENVLYTVCFDNARKGKNGGKMINPNDPQQNPDFFPVDRPPVKGTPSRTRVEPEVQVGQGVIRPKNENRYDPAVRRTTNDPYHQQRSDFGANSRDNSRRPVRQTGAPERSIEQSPLHPHNTAKTGGRGGGVSSPSWERKPSESNHGLAPYSPLNSRLKSSEKAAAIPRFGDWDEKNPSAAEGYTVIFNKVREDKQTGMANGIAMPQASTPNRQKQTGSDNSTVSFLTTFFLFKSLVVTVS
ncbi:Pathogenic type III effector avirulence factor Avr cleavage site [Macleaya cordata]|uniref:Pathogenic type III effector avirulence factor Avr cleavage site n=1 Tax=Macleaya cordata TaxID=56857 RepID=A0A200Q6V9_MACCD|nr:Pathogenic type III effector avirulence factor Avr cleavage site [Macleaya cordata]